jgi:putative addiction module killer protein
MALILQDGSCPIESWWVKLRDQSSKQRIQSRIDRLERGNFGDCNSIGGGVNELRIDYGPGYRVYYAISGIKTL